MTTASRKSAAKTRGKPFEPGNPGKPKGARHRLTVLAEKLMEDDAEEVTRAVIKAAKGGDMGAARLILDRVAPPRKGRPLSLSLPDVRTGADTLAALSRVIAEMGAGQITPDEAVTVAGLLEIQRRSVETVNLEARIAELESRLPQGGAR